MDSCEQLKTDAFNFFHRLYYFGYTCVQFRYRVINSPINIWQMVI
jgi:hypothetical protein